MENQYFSYRHHKNIESMIDFISSSQLPPDSQIKFLFLISQKNLFESIEKWLPYKYSLKFLEKHENFATIYIKKEIKKGNLISGYFNLARYENSNIYIATTFEKQRFVKSVLIKFFENNYPEESRLSLTSEQLRELLNKLKRELNCEIITDSIVAYSKLNRKIITLPVRRFRFKESNVKWTEEDYNFSFSRAAENDQWIDKISFFTQKEGKLLFHASLSRGGLFKCNKAGNVNDFYRIITTNLLNIGEKNTSLFSNKSRLENKGKIRPIEIEYDSNLFENSEQNKRLINVISEFPKSSYSLYHGNPYVHASVVDYIDGSSYELWVVSMNKIIIIPQLRATFNSLSRFCEHILKRFLEGKVSELGVDEK